MRATLPKVRLIGRPSIDWGELRAYLDSIGANQFADRITYETRRAESSLRETIGQLLVEIAGRLCYRSWEPGLNANVTKVREDRGEYLLNILKSGHGSVLEHANYSFIFQDVSRVFTHEMVRHRVGTAISQESLRFVRLTDIPFWMPEWAKEDKELANRAEELLYQMEQFQTWMAAHFKLDDKGVPFSEKKHKTSFMRRFAPIGLSTSMVWSANIRTIRHVIERRTDIAAEEEMRVVAPQLAEIMFKEAPLLFGDYSVVDGQWSTPYGKV